VRAAKVKAMPVLSAASRAADTVGGQLHVVERCLRPSGIVVDVAADDARLHRLPDGFGDSFRLHAVATLEVSADRQVDGAGDAFDPSHHLLAPEAALIVGHTEREGDAAAGGGERRKSGGLKHTGAAGVPRIGCQESATVGVEAAESLALRALFIDHCGRSLLSAQPDGPLI